VTVMHTVARQLDSSGLQLGRPAIEAVSGTIPFVP